MVSMHNTKTQIMENIKNCQICKKQRIKLKLQMSIILPSNISNKIANYNICKTCSKVSMTMAQENQETDKLHTIKRFEPEEIQIFYFTKLNPYPSYKEKKMKSSPTRNKQNFTRNLYTRNLEKHLKTNILVINYLTLIKNNLKKNLHFIIYGIITTNNIRMNT